MKKIWTKEVQIAVAAIVAAVLLVLGINFLRGINLFQRSNQYYVTFDNIQGLTISNAVYANGYPVGIVRSIAYPYATGTGKVVISVEINEAMSVPTETKAELESSLLGETKMNLILGKNPLEKMSAGDTIVGSEAHGLMNQAAALIPTLQGMLPKIDSILQNLNKLTANPALHQSVNNLATITQNFKQTSAALNGLMQKDMPTLMHKANNVGSNLEQISTNLAAIDLQTPLKEATASLQKVNAITTNLDHKIQSKDNSMGLLLNDRGLYDNINSTFANADSLLLDLRLRPKRYVHFSIFGKKAE